MNEDEASSGPENTPSEPASVPGVRVRFESDAESLLEGDVGLRDRVSRAAAGAVPGALKQEAQSVLVSVENRVFEVKLRMVLEGEVLALVSIADLTET